MKVVLFFTLLLTMYSGVVIGQKISKPPIDTSVFGKWPQLNNGFRISNDGLFVAYVVNFHRENVLVFHSTINGWRKEIVDSNIYGSNKLSFTQDSKAAMFNLDDSLYFLELGTDKLHCLGNITSFDLPKANNWLVYLLKNQEKNLVLKNTITHEEHRFENVLDYDIDGTGESIVFTSQLKKGNNILTSVCWLNLAQVKVDTIWSSIDLGKKIVSGSLNFAEKGNQVLFMVQDKATTFLNNSIWYYKSGMEKAVMKVNNESKGIEAGLSVAGVPMFTMNGKWISFELQSIEKKLRPEPEAVMVDVWSYRDAILQPEQLIGKKKTAYAAVIATDSDIVVRLEKDDERIEGSLTLKNLTGDYIVVKDHFSIDREYWWPHEPQPSFWIVSLKDGSRQLLKNKNTLMNMSFSPGGRWLVYWDSDKSNYFIYDILLKTIFNSTVSISKQVKLDYIGGVAPTPVDDVAGWMVGDSSFFIYDKYDIWKVDPSGKVKPLNITNSFGRKNSIVLRFVYTRHNKCNHFVLENNETVLLTAFNSKTKYNGFFSKELGRVADPTLLTMGPYTYYYTSSQFDIPQQGLATPLLPVKALNTNRWILVRQSSTEAPNFYVTEDFKIYTALTNFCPQQKYNWLTTKLLTWKMPDGKMCQGVLYKPENFDPKKKYPVIFHYYEKMSHNLYQFPYPFATENDINIPWFVSRGYLVFTPDIYYSVANTKNGELVGEAATKSVVSAATYLSSLPFVDGKKMGIQGHSFGGGETNFIVTHTNIFAAASSAACTVSDQISAYLGLKYDKRKPIGDFRLSHSETGHDLIGATLWQRPDLYIKASPVFKADKVNTPLLLMHNQADVITDWGQSVELYMALRRLGKQCWMLQYDEGDHSVGGRDAMDFTMRLTQFFDHYLKGDPAPKWMTRGIPAEMKSVDNGLELDAEGNCSKNCIICKKWMIKVK